MALPEGGLCSSLYSISAPISDFSSRKIMLALLGSAAPSLLTTPHRPRCAAPSLLTTPLRPRCAAPSLLTTPLRPRLLATSPEETARCIGGSGRSRQVWEILRSGGDPFTSDELGGKARRALVEAFEPVIYQVLTSTVSSCGTCKLLIQLPSLNEVETVIIPHASGAFSTLCVSSQFGCRQGCSFCATGTMGLQGNLKTDEILAQLHAAVAAIESHRMPRLRNVVTDQAPLQASLAQQPHASRLCTPASACVLLPDAPLALSLRTFAPCWPGLDGHGGARRQPWPRRRSASHNGPSVWVQSR